jgi:hypothetical protein
VVVAAAAPLRVTDAPLPPATGLSVPEMPKVRVVAVKLIPVVTLALLIVTVMLLGLKLYPAWLGVIVYVPLPRPDTVKFPELLAVAVAFAGPAMVTVAPFPPATGVIVPEMLNVCGGGVEAVELWPLTIPEHPQASRVGKSIPRHKIPRSDRESGAGELPIALPASLFCPKVIVQTLSTSLNVRVRP